MRHAFTATLILRKLLREQNELLEYIYKKPTMEIGDVHNALVRDSNFKGANMRGGNMRRLVTAHELYE